MSNGTIWNNRDSSKSVHSVRSDVVIWYFWMACCMEYMEKILNASRSILRNVKRYNPSGNGFKSDGPENSGESRNSKNSSGTKGPSWSYFKKIRLKVIYYISMKIYTLNERSLEIQQTDILIKELLKENNELIERIQQDSKELVKE